MVLKEKITDIGHAQQKLSEGAITSVQLTEAILQRIEQEDEKLGSFLWLNKEASLAMAEASDARRKKGESKGALDGIPMSLKDMILQQGFFATAASRILEGYKPSYDATVSRKLVEHGAVIIGKTNQDEFAFGSSNETSAFKPCRNPWDLSRTPGGSSGGGAASISAGFGFGSLGTDTGGSIRQPAAYSGVVGLKPTYGRVSRYGVIAFASSLDQVGPFSRTVKDAAHMLNAIAGHDEKDATSAKIPVPSYAQDLKADVRGLKIGVPKEYFIDGIDDDVRKAVNKSIEIFEKNGAIIKQISLPHTKYAVATYYIIATAEASSNLSRYDGIRFGPRVDTQKDLLSLYENTRGSLFGTEVKRRIILGTYVLSAGYYDAYYLKAQKVRRLFARDFIEAFNEVDLIVSPTTPTTAFKIDEKIDDPIAMYLNDIFTISANLAGICGISVPSGFDQKGLPIGTQIMARPFDEQKLFNAAHLIEESLNLDLFPPLYR